jgi:mono/diheme cytochrome c family protein
MRAALRTLAVSFVAAAAVLAMAGVASAQDLIIEVAAPDEGILGEPVEIAATVRDADTGEPIEGAAVVYFGDASFAGVSGEVELGTAESNVIGVATLQPTFSVSRLHTVRVEILDNPDVEPKTVSIPIRIGSQLIASEAGVSIPGLGSWIVPFVILSAWVIMITAAFGMVVIARGEAEPGASDSAPLESAGSSRFNVAVVATGLMSLIAVGLLSLLLRGPETHSNLNPEGYDRTAVAYLEASYLYAGPGHSEESLTGDAIDDGRVLFMSAGCAGCHGVNAQGTAAARSPAFATRVWLGTIARSGQPGGMPAYSEGDLTDTQLDSIHAFLLDARDQISGEAPAPPATTAAPTTTGAPSDTAQAPDNSTTGTGAAAVSFDQDVLPIFKANCTSCHGVAGGWTATDYDSAVTTGASGSVVVPGDVDASVLALKVLGTQTAGGMMPPGQALSQEDIDTILAWIEGGANK